MRPPWPLRTSIPPLPQGGSIDRGSPCLGLLTARTRRHQALHAGAPSFCDPLSTSSGANPQNQVLSTECSGTTVGSFLRNDPVVIQRVQATAHPPGAGREKSTGPFRLSGHGGKPRSAGVWRRQSASLSLEQARIEGSATLIKLILRVFATGFILSLPSLSAANPIVFTGTPTDTPGATFYTSQYFAGEFTIVDSYLVQTVQGYFGNQDGNASGTVDVAIHAVGGNLPGLILFTSPIVLAANAPLGWYGVSGMGWELAPGTYWASFRPSNSIEGSMPEGVASPMTHYAAGVGNTPYAWFSTPSDFGVLIDGRLVNASVPDSTSTLSLFLGVALLGFVAQRLWT